MRVSEALCRCVVYVCAVCLCAIFAHAHMNNNTTIEYIIVADGQQIVDAYTKDYAIYNLIFMDVCMPVLDGLAATRAIREFEQKMNLPRVIIVALSAQVMESDQKECTRYVFLSFAF